MSPCSLQPTMALDLRYSGPGKIVNLRIQRCPGGQGYSLDRAVSISGAYSNSTQELAQTLMTVQVLEFPQPPCHVQG